LIIFCFRKQAVAVLEEEKAKLHAELLEEKSKTMQG
jgi:hypothetical protein